MIAAVGLDEPRAAALLARALDRERRRVTGAGDRWPPSLDQLTALAVRAASGSAPRSATTPGRGETLRLVDAARVLGVSVRTLHRLRSSGEIPTTTVGATPMVRRVDVDAYLERQESG